MQEGCSLRELSADLIAARVAVLCQEANFDLPPDVLFALNEAGQQEDSLTGRRILDELRANAGVAASERIPVCQDTGMVIAFVEVGQDLHITGGSLADAINRGVAQGYRDGYLRASVVVDPLHRANTGNNAPAVIHYDIVPGDGFHITIMPKGFGSENCTALGMLKPTDGLAGVRQFVVAAVAGAGASPCPPVSVGVGLGGTADKALLLARQALLRPLGRPNPDPDLAALESELKAAINDLGYGPGGFGGRVTALAVHVETYPTHIAGLPVAVNISCHALRHKTWVYTD
jgi:fumarate hydratase subunit alpha